MGHKDRGPRPKPDGRARFLRDPKATFEWRGDRPNPRWAADPTGWWADASIRRRLGPTLAEPFTDLQPTLVLGPQSRGTLAGAAGREDLSEGFRRQKQLGSLRGQG